jgi:hypothetical protein
MKRLISLLMISLVLASCGAAAPAAEATQVPAGVSEVQPTELVATIEPPTTPAELKIVRLGFVPVMIYAPLYVGIERGYFAAEGIQIESTPVQGGSEPVVQMAAGNFDAAFGGAGAGLLNAAARGVKFSIVAPMHNESAPLTSPLVISAKRVDELKSVADLKGKKVAINATGAATFSSTIRSATGVGSTLSINAPVTVLAGSIGGIGGESAQLGSLTTNDGGSLSLGGSSILVAGDVTLGDAVTLTNDVTIDSGGNIAIRSTIDSDSVAARALALNSGGSTANTVLVGNIGQSNALASLTTNAAGTTMTISSPTSSVDSARLLPEASNAVARP